MDRDRAKQLVKCAHLIKAFAEGNVIQYERTNRTLIDINSPSFDSRPEDYVIKPKKIERWVNIYSDEYEVVHISKAMAFAGSVGALKVKTVHLVEADD